MTSSLSEMQMEDTNEEEGKKHGFNDLEKSVSSPGVYQVDPEKDLSITTTTTTDVATATGTQVNLDKKDDIPWTLETLPNEMFLHVCSFIDAGFLIHRLSLVCKQFRDILGNEQTWKIRQTKRWGINGKYPPVPVIEDEFPWSRACVKREEQIKLWGNSESNLQNVELRGHIGCVDAVHLFEGGKYLASGSRDRSIVIWDVEKCFTNSIITPAEIGSREVAVASSASKLETKTRAHRGWIWSIASNSSHLLSASWDTSVRIWDRKADFQLVTEFPTRVACLALSAMDNLVACGTYDRKVLLFDPRSGYQPITWYTAHSKAVLALGMDESRIITCAEDGKVVLYDLRGKRIQKTLTLPDTNSYPVCLSFRREDPGPWFYIGDKSGNVHLIDSVDFSIVQSYSIGQRTIQGVFHSLGSVVTSSRDGTMKIFEPSSGLRELASYSINEELPAVHSLYNTVALAGADGIVRLWSPRQGL